jgi:EmrB/QacA subfamily drug resistance transporter
MDTVSTTNPGPAGTGHPPRLRRDALLAAASIAQFMVVLDVTIINVALPEMRTALHMSAGGQQWVINAYTLTFAGFLMLGGRAADLFGRRRVFLAGLAVFTLFSLLGGLAQTGGELIAARAAQGVGGAILAPATLSLLTAEFTEHHERRRALGVWSATAASGAAGGLLLGGVLTGLLGWRWVLFVNVPIGFALIVAAVLSLPESTGRLASRSLDLAGAATLTGGMAVLVYGIVSTGAHPWGSARTITVLAAAAALLILFVLIEARFAPSPIVPLRTFRRRSLSVANVLSTAAGVVVFGNYFFLSLYLQEVKHYSPLRAGLAFLPIGLTTFAGALVASHLVHRLGIRRQLVIAPLITAAAGYWLSRLSPGSGYFGSLFVPLVLAGASIGVTFVPMTMAATTGVPPAEAGLASGLLNTSRQLGGALGLAVLATVASAATRHQAGHGAAAAAALNHGYTRAFLVIAAVAAAGAVTALFLRPSAHVPFPSRSSATSAGSVGDRERPEVDVEL